MLPTISTGYLFRVACIVLTVLCLPQVARANLSVTPTTTLTFSGSYTGPFSPSSGTYRLSSGTINESYTVSSNQPWLTISPSSGTVSFGSPDDIAFSINSGANALLPGTHTATVTFSGNNTVTRTVTLTVIGPIMNVTPSALSSSGFRGGPFSSLGFTITNTGNQTLNWSVSANQSWLVVPPGDAVGSGQSLNRSVLVSNSANNFLPGTYTGTVTFTNTSNGVGNTTRPATLTVNVGNPVLSVTPSTDYDVSGLQGGPFAPFSTLYTLRNTGNAALEWELNDGPYNESGPSSGTLAAGAAVNVTVFPNSTALSSLNIGNAFSQQFTGAFQFRNLINGSGNTSRNVNATVRNTCRDQFADALDVNLLRWMILGKTNSATGQSGEPNHAGASTPLTSIWCRWTAVTNGPVIIDTTGSSIDTTLAVYTGASVTSLTPVASSNDIIPGLNRHGRVSFQPQINSTYYVVVDGAGASTGDVVLNWTQNQPPGGASVFAAVLPYARSIVTGRAASAFGTIINGGSTTATGCQLQAPSGFPGTFVYQTTDAANQLVGTPNTPVDIPAGAAQSFVFVVTPGFDLNAAEIAVLFRCSNAGAADGILGVNSFILSASATQSPDLVAISATPTSDGIVNIPGPNGTGFFATAAVNVGTTGDLVATVDDGGKGLPMTIALCQTDPGTGSCVNPPNPAASVPFTASADIPVTFSIFVVGAGSVVPFDPANNRLFVRFSTPDAVTRGATSVAVRTQ